MENKLKVGIAHGDVNGISYELIINIMEDNRLCEICTPILYGSSKVVAYHRKTLNLENLGFNSITSPQNANPKRCNIINCVDDEIKVELGQETPEADKAAMTALKRALDDLDRGDLDVVVMAPQTSASFAAENSHGVTDFLGRRYRARNIMPLLVGPNLRMSFMTNHIPLKDVASQINIDNCFFKIRQLSQTLQTDFTIDKPVIGVMGLNPHTTHEAMGEEETNVIVPAIERLRERGIMALGPYSAERLFTGVDYEKFDLVMAMYHDQGMIPFNTLVGKTGTMMFAGIPVVVTSTAHGVAYDIAGKGEADDTGMRNAIYMAIDAFNNRTQNMELSSNPLKHYDVGGNANETDMNVEQIVGIKEEEVEL
ncbi:MAG: PdxA family dehydrogenase [Marinifilaceae bacterium]